MAAFGVFGLLQLFGAFNWVKGRILYHIYSVFILFDLQKDMTPENFYIFARTTILAIVGFAVVAGTVASLTGCIIITNNYTYYL